MRSSALSRRIAAFAGYLGLLAALGMVGAVLVSGAPRLANGFTDDGLREDVARLPYAARDLTFAARPEVATGLNPGGEAGRIDGYRNRLPAPLPGLVGQQWFTGRVGPERVTVGGDQAPFNGSCRPTVSVRMAADGERAVRMLEGHWPASRGGAVEVVVARDAAETLGLRVGATFTLTGSGSTPVTIAGIFEPVDAAAPFWDDMRLALLVCPEPEDGTTYRIALLTDSGGLASAAAATGALTYEWRYRLDERRLLASELPAVTSAVVNSRRVPPAPEMRLTSSLDISLATFDRKLRAVQALIGVVQAGTLATLLGLILLAARLIVDRRREEFTLLRARGGSALGVGVRALYECLLVVPVAVLAGWLLGVLLPGRPADLEWLLVAGIGLVSTLAVPVLATAGQRRVTFVGVRRDLVRHRPSARRLTAEVFVLLIAVLGVVLVRQRGLSQHSGVDGYLVSVPVLLSIAAALIALRVVPWPLRQVGRLAARARGVVPFIGLASAGRGAPVSLGPLAVLVVAIATGVFTSVVTGTIDHARDSVSDQEIAGDALVTGLPFAPATTGRLAALPGVTAVSPLLLESGASLRTGSGAGSRSLGQAQLLVVDGPATARVLAQSGVDLRLPAELTRPGRIDGPVPAVVSPALAAELGDTGVIAIQGRRYEFRVAEVRTTFPGVDVGTTRYLAVPWQALPVPDFQPVVPNRYLIAGAGLSATALREVAAAGQREYQAELMGHPVAEESMPVRATATTWPQHRRGLEQTGVNKVLSFTFAVGAAGATLLALLAVGFTVLAEAPGRGRTLSRLRTMGLSTRQGRRLLIYELVPLVGVAVLAGGLVGIALPRLLGPALELSNFTAGVAARTYVDPLLAAGVLVLVVVTLAAAMLIENALNRRLRLGEVLRLGEES